MADQDKKPADDTESINKIIESVNSTLKDKLSEQNDNIDGKFSDIDKKIDSMQTKPKEEGFFGYDSKDEDDDGYITKKDLKTFSQFLKKTILTEATDITKTTVNNAIESKTSQNARDTAAMTEYPMMNKQSPEFNKEFYDAVTNELKLRTARGRDPDNDSDLLYDSASAIFSRWAKTGKHITKAMAKNQYYNSNSKEDSFSTDGTNKNASKALNSRQIELAARFGMNKETITQHVENKKEF